MKLAREKSESCFTKVMALSNKIANLSPFESIIEMPKIARIHEDLYAEGYNDGRNDERVEMKRISRIDLLDLINGFTADATFVDGDKIYSMIAISDLEKVIDELGSIYLMGKSQ